MGRRYALRDGHWHAVKRLLPGDKNRLGPLRVATVFLRRQYCIGIMRSFLGEIYRSGLVTGRMPLNG